jgi:hypothetical protein
LLWTDSMCVDCVDAVRMRQVKIVQCQYFVQCLVVLNKQLAMVAWFAVRLCVIHLILTMNSKTLVFLFVHTVELKLNFFLMKIGSIFMSEML